MDMYVRNDCGGVRQRGVLSLYLFALYINDLITELRNSIYSFGVCGVSISPSQRRSNSLSSLL